MEEMNTSGQDSIKSDSNFENETGNTSQHSHEAWNQVPPPTTENKKILAGILAIVLGGFGVHKFVLGYNKEGIILLVCTLVLGIITCGLAGWVVWVISLVEGIIYLTKTDEEFYNTYQAGYKPWF